MTHDSSSSQHPSASKVNESVSTHNDNKQRSASPLSHITPAIGKAIRAVARLRGGGSALPGKVVESFDPAFMARTLSQLPLGVLLVSGTNGKTTTTRIISKTLENLGLKVFTNPTGSNFTRGVVSSLISQVNSSGRLDADIAVLELDEAYAVHFVQKVRPRYAVLLNVMRDQLDRFGEIDTTARLLAHVARATTGTIILNREDSRIAALSSQVPTGTKVSYFGLEPELRSSFPSDDEMPSTAIDPDDCGKPHQNGLSESKRQEVPKNKENTATTTTSNTATAASAATASQQDFLHQAADVILSKVTPSSASFIIDNHEYSSSMKLAGIYNLFNAAAAIAVIRAVLHDAKSKYPGLGTVTTERLLTAMSQVTPAFGRGEVIDVHGTPVELVLVKNPAGFRLALASFDPSNVDTMIAINDEYADGRDMSWLWDVDFSSLEARGVAMVSGVRCWDMALRLAYADVSMKDVEQNLSDALNSFITTNPETPKRIYCTYTAMLKIRADLAGGTALADINK